MVVVDVRESTVVLSAIVRVYVRDSNKAVRA